MAYSDDELSELGFASIGTDVQIDRRAAIFGASSMHVGSHVRIDCFSVITAGQESVRIGSYTHIAAHTYLSGSSRWHRHWVRGWHRAVRRDLFSS